MTPNDVLAMPAMAPTDFLNAVNQPITAPSGYLEIDLNQSTQWQLWCSSPGQNTWFAVPVSAIQTVQPVRYSDEMNLRKIICAVVFR